MAHSAPFSSRGLTRTARGRRSNVLSLCLRRDLADEEPAQARDRRRSVVPCGSRPGQCGGITALAPRRSTCRCPPMPFHDGGTRLSSMTSSAASAGRALGWPALAIWYNDSSAAGLHDVVSGAIRSVLRRNRYDDRLARRALDPSGGGDGVGFESARADRTALRARTLSRRITNEPIHSASARRPVGASRGPVRWRGVMRDAGAVRRHTETERKRLRQHAAALVAVAYRAAPIDDGSSGCDGLRPPHRIGRTVAGAHEGDTTPLFPHRRRLGRCGPSRRLTDREVGDATKAEPSPMR